MALPQEVSYLLLDSLHMAKPLLLFMVVGNLDLLGGLLVLLILV
jgi:hypothetical protein